MASDRFRRTDPERTGPIRDLSGVFRQDRGRPLPWSPEAWGIPRSWGPWVQGSEAPHQEADDGTPADWKPADWKPWWSAFPNEAAARGVRTGYQVAVEELGSEAEARAADGDEAPSPSGMPGPEDVQNLTVRMWRYAADLMWLWSDLMGAMARGQAPASKRTPPSPGPDGGGAPERRGAEEQPTAVTVEVASRAAVRVQVAIDPRARGALAVQKLRDLQEIHEPIAGAEVVVGQGTSIVRLDVPDDQPAGRYSGVVLSREKQQPVGHLTVDVLGPTAAGD